MPTNRRTPLAPSALAAASILLLSAPALAQRAPHAACPSGQSRSVDTAGHCCWPTQVWSRARQTCVGVPQCPANMQLSGEQCVMPPCPDGQLRTADTGEQCCWPGQAYSTQAQRCVGVPQCTGTLVVDGESCAAAPSCDNGQVAVGSHCCWPGQTWSATRAACEGTPQCPAGLVAQAETCSTPPPAECTGGQVAAGSHCCWPGQSWSDAASACTGDPRCPGDLVAAAGQCTRAACTGGRAASPASAGHCCWPGQSWDAQRQTCGGTPTTCPPGREPLVEDCALSTGALATPAALSGGPSSTTPPSATGARTTYQFAWLIVGGAGLLAAGGGAIPWLMADARYRTLRTACIQSGCPADASDAGDSIRTLEAASYALWIGGGAVTALGLTLFFATPRREAPHAGQSALIPTLGGAQWLLHF